MFGTLANDEMLEETIGATVAFFRAHDDYSALGQLAHAHPERIVVAEYARHMALRCRSMLRDCIDRPDFEIDAKEQARRPGRARLELDDAIAQLESLGYEDMRHVGD